MVEACRSARMPVPATSAAGRRRCSRPTSKPMFPLSTRTSLIELVEINLARQEDRMPIRLSWSTIRSHSRSRSARSGCPGCA